MIIIQTLRILSTLEHTFELQKQMLIPKLFGNARIPVIQIRTVNRLRGLEYDHDRSRKFSSKCDKTAFYFRQRRIMQSLSVCLCVQRWDGNLQSCAWTSTTDVMNLFENSKSVVSCLIEITAEYCSKWHFWTSQRIAVTAKVAWYRCQFTYQLKLVAFAVKNWSWEPFLDLGKRNSTVPWSCKLSAKHFQATIRPVFNTVHCQTDTYDFNDLRNSARSFQVCRIGSADRWLLFARLASGCRCILRRSLSVHWFIVGWRRFRLCHTSACAFDSDSVYWRRWSRPRHFPTTSGYWSQLPIVKVMLTKWWTGKSRITWTRGRHRPYMSTDELGEARGKQQKVIWIVSEDKTITEYQHF